MLLSLFMVCAVSARAQDQTPPDKKACVVYTMQDLSVGGATADFAQPITASISAAIEVSGYSMIPADAWGAEVRKGKITPRALLRENTGIAVARALDADLAVSGYYVVQDEQVFISLQCWDVRAGRLVTGLQEKARFNLAFYSFLHDRVAQMLQRVALQEPTARDGTPAGSAQEAPRVPLSQITFLSPDEGMEIRLAGDLSIGTVGGGKLLWKAEGIGQGTDLLVEKRKPGFHSSWQTVRVLEEIKLSKLEKEYPWAISADWTWGQLAGAGTTFRAYTNPDWFFFFLGTYLFLQPPLSSAGSPVYHADFSLGAGSYLFFPPDFPIRLGISAGAGLVGTFSGSGAIPPGTDWYLNVLNW